MPSKRFTFWASAFYFAFYSASGSFGPFLNAHFQQSGVGIEQIGILSALGQVTLLVANPLWSFAADAFHMHRRLLPLSMALLLPLAWLLARAGDFWSLAPLVLLYFACLAPIIPLGDSAVMESLGEDRYRYGRLRIWGAVGYGAAAWYGGMLMERLGIRFSVLVFVALMGLGAWVAARLPHPRPLEKAAFRSSLRALTADRRWYPFLGSVLLAGIGASILNNYLILYMGGLGAGEGTFGLSVLVAGVSELPVFFFSGWLLRRFSPRGVIALSLAALAARLALVAWLKDPMALVAVQALHGLTFSALWAAGVNYASELSPRGLGASGQALFSTTLFGLAGTLGAFAGGQIYHNLGPSAVFQAGAALAALGLAIFLFGARQARRKLPS